MGLDSNEKLAATFIVANLLTGTIAYAADRSKPTIHFVPEFNNMLSIGTNTTGTSYIVDFSFLSPVERKIQKATLPGYVTPTVLEQTIREATEQRPITIQHTTHFDSNDGFHA